MSSVITPQTAMPDFNHSLKGFNKITGIIASTDCRLQGFVLMVITTAGASDVVV